MKWLSEAFNKEYYLIKSPKHRRWATLVLGLGVMGSLNIFLIAISLKQEDVFSVLMAVSIPGWLVMLSVIESVDLTKRKWARLATVFWICVCLGASVTYWIILFAFGEPDAGIEGESLRNKVNMAGSIPMHLILLIIIYSKKWKATKKKSAACLSSNNAKTSSTENLWSG